MSELRTDPLTGQAVIIAPSRGARPHSEGDDAPRCPFCPGQEAETPPSVLELSLGASKSWFVRVFPNLFPIVSSEVEEPDKGPEGARMTRGAHEVIVETPRHEQQMHERTPAEVELTLTAYKHRLLAHLGAPGIRYVAVFQNSGREAGASLEHPHSQVIALSYVPNHVSLLARRWRRYHTRSNACLLCDQLKRERKDGARVVREQGGFVLYAPYGSVRPGELMLAPLQHRTRFEDEDLGAMDPLSELLIYGLRQMNAAFDDLSYNLVLQNWPRGKREDAALHWYLRMIPRRTELGGFELSTGDFVSSLAPDDAAAMYRKARG